MLKLSRTTVLELDGVAYKFADNTLEQIQSINDVEGDHWLVSDLDTAISRTMIVEAEYKYVELMVRKTFQESGEFDGPISVITHWKKKKGANATEIFFTALPTHLYHQYQELVQAHEDSVLLFPLYSVLYGVLNKLKSEDPAAVIFQHGRFADVIIGSTKRVYFATRCVSFDTSEEQIASLWETIKADIDTVEADNRIQVNKIITLNWIDSMILPEWTEEKECDYYPFETESIKFNGETHDLSFLKAVDSTTGFKSTTPPVGICAYYAKKCAPYVSAACLIMIFLMIGGYFWFNKEAGILSDEIKIAVNQISDIQAQEPLNISDVDYKNTLSFIQNLSNYKTAPSYKTIINDLSDASFFELKLEVLKMDYVPGAVQMEIFGKIEAPFEMAHKGYQRFLRVLKNRGYSITDSQFNTEIRTSHFLMSLSRRI